MEVHFACYCRPEYLPASVRMGLHRANVEIVDVFDGKPGAADRHLMAGLNRFEKLCRPPNAVVVLISSDIDFVQKLSDMRYATGYQIIVVHNLNMKKELREMAHVCFLWKDLIGSY